MTQRRSLCAHGVTVNSCSICSRTTDRGYNVNVDQTERRGRLDPVRAFRRLLRVGGFSILLDQPKDDPR